MPLKSALASAGVFRPQELVFLRQIFEEMALDGDTDPDREARAAALVRLYRSGIQTRPELLKEMGFASVATDRSVEDEAGGVRRRLRQNRL